MELSEQLKKQGKTGFSILPRLFANFEIQAYYQSKPKFNGVYSENNLLVKKREAQIKDGTFVINLDKYKLIGTLYVLCVNGDNVKYFDSFGDKNITTKIYRIQAYNSICE